MSDDSYDRQQDPSDTRPGGYAEADPSATLRVGAVQYLNAVPLLWRLDEIANDCGIHASIDTDVPSRLARRLVAGEFDVGMIPVVEAMRHPELVQVSDVCIASEGAVGSIRFIAFRPMDELRHVGLDPSSRTSNALLQLCLRERFGLRCEFELVQLDLENADFSITSNCEQLAETCTRIGLDGILLIGDKALSVPHRVACFPWIYDMGQLWTQWIGLPFVFASWFARPECHCHMLSPVLNEARKASQIEMDTILLQESEARGMTLEMCRDYLTRKVRFRLSGRERRGAEVFCKMLQKYGLVPLGTDLQFEANRKRFGAGLELET